MPLVRCGKADKERGEHGKDKCLQKRNKKLKQIDENGKWNWNCYSHNVAFQNEADEDQAENDDMARCHVSKESNRQSERLGKLTDNLNRNHDNPERPVSPCCKVLKIPFDTVSFECCNLGDEESENGKRKGDVDVAGRCCAVRNKTEQVTEPILL